MPHRCQTDRRLYALIGTSAFIGTLALVWTFYETLIQDEWVVNAVFVDAIYLVSVLPVLMLVWIDLVPSIQRTRAHPDYEEWTASETVHAWVAIVAEHHPLMQLTVWVLAVTAYVGWYFGFVTNAHIALYTGLPLALPTGFLAGYTWQQRAMQSVDAYFDTDD